MNWEAHLGKGALNFRHDLKATLQKFATYLLYLKDL